MFKKVSKKIEVGAQEFDVLGDLFETLRFRGTIFFNSKLAAPWGMLAKQYAYPRFHIVLKGSCFIGSDEFATTEVPQGSVVLLPRGTCHWIADQPDRKLVSCDQASNACRLNSPLFQKGELTHQLICGEGKYDTDTALPIFDSLPAIVNFPSLSPSDPIWVTAIQIDTELNRQDNQNPGQSNPIVDRLSEVLFLQMLKRYSDNNPGQRVYIAALQDRRVQKVVELVHQNPDIEWSLDLLGEQVGMARATLTRNFKEALGATPMQYINNWRLIKAKGLLKNSNHSISEIAELVGFASSRTLSKAFKRKFGITPYELKSDKEPVE